MSIRNSLLNEIEAVQKKMALSDRAFSIGATGNPKFMSRLRKGNVTLASVEAAKKHVTLLKRTPTDEARA